jgi:galactose oxidase
MIAAPTTIQYGASFSVTTPDAAGIARVTLVRPGSVTHAFNFDQRFLELTFPLISGALNVQAPSNANMAPPGYYMLFIVDASGVPSVAAFVRLP